MACFKVTVKQVQEMRAIATSQGNRAMPQSRYSLRLRSAYRPYTCLSSSEQ